MCMTLTVFAGIDGTLTKMCALLALLYAGFDTVRPFLEDGLSLLFAAGTLRFFTPEEVAMGVAFGALVGLLGSRAAAGRYVVT